MRARKIAALLVAAALGAAGCNEGGGGTGRLDSGVERSGAGIGSGTKSGNPAGGKTVPGGGGQSGASQSGGSQSGGGAAAGSTSSGIQAGPGATGLALVPPTGSTKQGAAVTVDVVAASTIPGLFTAGFELHYDPAALAYVSFDTSKSALAGGSDAAALKNGAPGVLVFGRSLEAPATGIAMKGEVATFTFTAVAPGTTSVTLEAPAFLDASAADLGVTAPPAASVVIVP